MLINSITHSERSQLLEVAIRTKLFSAHEAESLLGGIVDGLVAGALADGHQAASCRLEAQEPARRFYTLSGYKECGRIPHFYGQSEAKVIFARALPFGE